MRKAAMAAALWGCIFALLRSFGSTLICYGNVKGIGLKAEFV